MKIHATLSTLLLIMVIFITATGCSNVSSDDDRHSAQPGRTYVVNKRAFNASDVNPGTESRPLKTIQAGADHAQPGDTVLVKAGVYREEVVPPRGGASPELSITYRAAPGADVSIRGSEQINTWQSQGDGVWMVELDTTFFKGYNPFAIPVDGEWLVRCDNRRLGDVYCNDEALIQTINFDEMQSTPNTWYTDLNYGYIDKFDFPADRQYPNGTIQIWANFGDIDPNSALTEINARATVIFPEIAGLKYIVIDGFDIRHTAPQWADIYTTEKGAIGTRYGYGWTIQNCTISYSRNVGISLGVTDEIHFPREDEGGLLKGGNNIPPLDEIGHHLIRKNVINRCGQTGIYGCYGAVGSIIEGNEVTETNYRNEWIGMNQAAIKILFPIDVIIRDNLLIAALGVDNFTKGIWLDWGSQNTRVTGNIMDGFTSKSGWAMFLEVNFGPIIVDNNIIRRSDIHVMSNGSVFAHNLFQDCNFELVHQTRRITPYYIPHSTVRSGKAKVSLQHTRIYNNIVIGGTGFVAQDSSDVSDITVNHNIYLNGAMPFPNKDAQSVVIDSKTDMQLQLNDHAATLKITLPPASLERKHRLITSKLIGKIPYAEMYMEHPDGMPLDLTSDFFGKAIDPANVLPGPFQELGNGENSVTLWPKSRH